MHDISHDSLERRFQRGGLPGPCEPSDHTARGHEAALASSSILIESTIGCAIGVEHRPVRHRVIPRRVSIDSMYAPIDRRSVPAFQKNEMIDRLPLPQPYQVLAIEPPGRRTNGFDEPFAVLGLPSNQQVVKAR